MTARAKKTNGSTNGGAVRIVEQIRNHQEKREKLVHLFALRLDDDLNEKIENRAREVETACGLRVSRLDVIRVLLEIGLGATGESKD